MTKSELRKEFLARRKALTSTERQKMDDLLLIRFQQLALPSLRCLMNYWPMPEKGEPDTHLFEDFLHFRNPGLLVAYPRTDPATGDMQAIWVNEETDFQRNPFQVSEPVSGTVADPADFDLIIVPLLAFDERGYRVGFGKGYYDRFLSRCRKDCLKTGFSYFGPVKHIDDTHEFDVPLDHCVTPQHLYVF